MSGARRIVVVLAVTGLLGLVAAPARAAWLEKHAWWWLLQTGLQGIEVPEPGAVPEGGLMVERLLTGPSAVSAVRIDLEDGTDPVLTLTVAVDAGGPTAVITACPAVDFWLPGSAGRWDLRPAGDCDLGSVDGVRSDDGATWSWDLAPLASDGIVDILLLPGPTPMRVTFEPPDDTSVATTPAPVHTTDPDTMPVPGQDDGLPDDPNAAPLPPPTVGGSVLPPAPVQVDPPADRPVLTPEVAPQSPVTPGSPSTDAADPSVAQPVTSPVDPATARRVGLVLLAATLLALMALLASRWPWAAVGVQIGGLGRFQRERHDPPPPLR